MTRLQSSKYYNGHFFRFISLHNVSHFPYSNLISSLLPVPFSIPLNAHDIIRISNEEWNECRHLCICNVYVVSLSHTCHWIDVMLMRDVSNPHPFNICFIHFLNSCSRNTYTLYTHIQMPIPLDTMKNYALNRFYRTKWNGMKRKKKSANNVSHTVTSDPDQIKHGIDLRIVLCVCWGSDWMNRQTMQWMKTFW